jgi:hypothetical protein
MSLPTCVSTSPLDEECIQRSQAVCVITLAGWDPQSPSSNQRRNLVEHWALNDSNYIDVGLTALIQDAEGCVET